MGRLDLWLFFDADEKLARSEQDTDFDGRINQRSFYEKGQILRMEEDTEHGPLPLPSPLRVERAG